MKQLLNNTDTQDDFRQDMVTLGVKENEITKVLNILSQGVFEGLQIAMVDLEKAMIEMTLRPLPKIDWSSIKHLIYTQHKPKVRCYFLAFVLIILIHQGLTPLNRKEINMREVPFAFG